MPVKVKRKRPVWLMLAVMFAMATATVVVPATRADASVFVTYWELKVRHSNKCAHVVDASVADGALVQQRTCSQARHQYVRLVPSPVANGYSEIRPWHSDKCLGVRAGSFDDGALIHQWACNGALSQQWLQVNVAPGWYQLRAMHSNKCLDVKGGSTADWTALQQWSCGTLNRQQWQFI
jgi:hypothetical protein